MDALLLRRLPHRMASTSSSKPGSGLRTLSSSSVCTLLLVRLKTFLSFSLDLTNGTVAPPQAALGTAPKDGERVVLQIGFGDQKFVLGTLVKSTCDQIHLDLVVDKDFTLEHNGSSSIFVAGYMTAHDFEMGREEDSEEEEEEEEEEEDDEEHEGELCFLQLDLSTLPQSDCRLDLRFFLKFAVEERKDERRSPCESNHSNSSQGL
jgi:hypothetical protein